MASLNEGISVHSIHQGAPAMKFSLRLKTVMVGLAFLLPAKPDGVLGFGNRCNIRKTLCTSMRMIWINL